MQLVADSRSLNLRGQHLDQARRQCRGMALSRAGSQLLRSSALILTSSRRVATSVASNQQQGGESAWTPPPFPDIQTIHLADAQAVANRVALTGNLGSDMERVETDQGVIGKLILYVKPDLKDRNKSDKYTIEVYGQMAAEADGKLRKGMRVHVEGRMWADKYNDKNGVGRMHVLVEADQISVAAKYTEPGSESETNVMPPPPVPPVQQQQQPPQQPPQPVAQPSANPAAQAAPAAAQAAPGAPRAPFVKITPEREAELWAELQEAPKNFWDNRVNKRNPKAPDYKHRQTGEGIWLSSAAAPQWTESLRP